jgi:hypothetical protein
MSLSRAKGQASLLDILVLGLFISIVVVMGLYIGNTAAQSQITREEAGYSLTQINTLMKYVPQNFGAVPNTNSWTMADAINQYFCNNAIGQTDLQTTIGDALNKTVRPGYNYIFYTYAATDMGTQYLWTWNKQSDVCAEYIPVVAFNMTVACPYTQYQKPLLGIWPEWKKLPPKANCTIAT